MRKLKLLFTNKDYRWATLEGLKLKFTSLPVIKHIFSCYYAYKMHNKTKNMSIRDRNIAFRKMERNSKEFCFTAALIRLQACIMAEGENENLEELFENAKSDVLSNEIINEAKYKDFKDWLEGINSSEKDYSRVQELINSFTKTQ